ncbi:MAG: biopolymer transport protein ExbB [Chthoniobacter sp.]|jgi:biopolymer transport protein ExbB|nr:biopolymer transport protein ExbB [Chthoniobacter sp.]
MPLIPLASLHSIYEFFAQGGFFMMLLVVCSVTAFSVIITRGLALRRDMVMPPMIAHEIEALQPEDIEGVAKLSRMVRNDMSALANVAQVGLQHLNWPKLENMEAVQTRARHELVQLEAGLFILEIIVGIAPLLGLLGAVSGLVSVFAAFGGDAAAQDPHGIAKGISEALSTTIVGLAIAIPSLIAHSYFSKKVENMASDMETLIAELLSKCYFQQEQRRPSARLTGAAPMPSPYSKREPAPEAAPIEEKVL